VTNETTLFPDNYRTETLIKDSPTSPDERSEDEVELIESSRQDVEPGKAKDPYATSADDDHNK
jgi:hypothetical protein